MSPSMALRAEVLDMVTSLPTGQASVRAARDAGGRTYVCNEDAHCVDVLGDDGRLLFSFGEYGSGPGQLHEPADVAVVHLSRRPEGSAVVLDDLVVVADRMNHRLQLFGLDGEYVAGIDPWEARPKRLALADRAGWPRFRVNPLPQLVLPSRLDWRAPFLHVTVGDGDVVVLDLELALLPDVRTWVETAPRATRPEELIDALLRTSGTRSSTALRESPGYMWPVRGGAESARA